MSEHHLSWLSLSRLLLYMIGKSCVLKELVDDSLMFDGMG